MNEPKTKVGVMSTTLLSLELTNAVAPMNRAFLDASDVDSLVTALAHLRAGMTPEVPGQAPDGTQVVTSADPRWSISVFGDGTKALLLRHPGFGWVTFVFPAAEAETIGHVLLGQTPPRLAQPSPTDSRH